MSLFHLFIPPFSKFVLHVSQNIISTRVAMSLAPPCVVGVWSLALVLLLLMSYCLFVNINICTHKHLIEEDCQSKLLLRALGEEYRYKLANPPCALVIVAQHEILQ